MRMTEDEPPDRAARPLRPLSARLSRHQFQKYAVTPHNHTRDSTRIHSAKAYPSSNGSYALSHTTSLGAYTKDLVHTPRVGSWKA